MSEMAKRNSEHKTLSTWFNSKKLAKGYFFNQGKVGNPKESLEKHAWILLGQKQMRMEKGEVIINLSKSEQQCIWIYVVLPHI